MHSRESLVLFNSLIQQEPTYLPATFNSKLSCRFVVFFHINIKSSMAAYVRKNVKDSILYAYVEDFFDASEFFLLYDSSYSRQLKPYWKFHSFKLDNFHEVQYLTEFPITNNDIYRLADVLQTPMKITCCQITVGPIIKCVFYTFKKISLSLPIYR